MRRSVILAMALVAASPAVGAQPVPPSDASIQGTQGPNGNTAGYPSAAVRFGRLAATGDIRRAPPVPANVAAGQPTFATANGPGITPGTPN